MTPEERTFYARQDATSDPGEFVQLDGAGCLDAATVGGEVGTSSDVCRCRVGSTPGCQASSGGQVSDYLTVRLSPLRVVGMRSMCMRMSDTTMMMTAMQPLLLHFFKRRNAYLDYALESSIQNLQEVSHKHRKHGGRGALPAQAYGIPPAGGSVDYGCPPTRCSRR